MSKPYTPYFDFLAASRAFAERGGARVNELAPDDPDEIIPFSEMQIGGEGFQGRRQVS